MMRVTWRRHWETHERTQALDTFLCPRDTYDTSGAIEAAQAQAEANAAAMGRLLAALVERNTFTLEQAAEVAGVNVEIVRVEE